MINHPLLDITHGINIFYILH
ncbi:CRISPR-associated DxTHG motif protein [Cohnella faecalis]